MSADSSNPEEAEQRRVAGAAAAKLVEPGMTVGLGTGETASELVKELARRQAEEGLRFQGVATSQATARLAASLNIPLVDLDSVARLDLVIDGADEVDDHFHLIKGGGGALLREKIVAAAASRRVIIISPRKRVSSLGHHTPVPVEVSRFGLRHTEQALRDQGASTSPRSRPEGAPFLTDEGHCIIDCKFPGIADPGELNCRLNCLPGVFETGLFVGLCDLLIVGQTDGAQLIERPV